MVRRAQGLGLLPAVGCLVLLMQGLARPALWLDESVSVVSSQRTFSHVRLMQGGVDAPLVPYYLMLKPLVAVLRHLPGLAGAPTELVYRLPSVLAMVGVVYVLTVWLAVRTTPLLAVSTAVALMACVGFSRYAQEARPYALVTLAAVLATVCWERMSRRPGWLADGAYAITVAATISLHLLAGTLIAAHLAAALWTTGTPENGRRRTALIRATVRTAVVAGLGVLLSLPFVVPAVIHGSGPKPKRAATFDQMWTTFSSVFSGDGRSLTFGGVLLLVLAALGTGQAFREPYRLVARLALCWALVPVALLVLVVERRPNLMMNRYVIFVLPAWALLAGLGVTVVAGLSGHLAGRLRSGEGRLAPAAGAVVAAVVLLGVVAAGQLPGLRAVRTSVAHANDDVRPLIAAASRPQYENLPIVMLSRNSTVQLAAYDRADEHRVITAPIQRDQPSPWPTQGPLKPRKLFKYPQVLVMIRNTPGPVCWQIWQRSPQRFNAQCLPEAMQKLDYRAQVVQTYGSRWTLAVTSRAPGATTAPGADGPSL